jgi:hypothetical protein
LNAIAYGGNGGSAPCPGAIVKNGAYKGPAIGTYITGLEGDYSTGLSSSAFTALNKDLCWAVTDASATPVTWSNAQSACGNDWRLPNLRELLALYEALGGSGRSVTDFSVLTNEKGEGGYRSMNMQANYYWSSTEYSGTNAYYIFFANGSRNNGLDKTTNLYARCVRSL